MAATDKPKRKKRKRPDPEKDPGGEALRAKPPSDDDAPPPSEGADEEAAAAAGGETAELESGRPSPEARLDPAPTGPINRDAGDIVLDAEQALERAADGADVATPEEAEEEIAAGQLGIGRYVLAAFFATGMIGAYVLGRAIGAIWANLATKDFFSSRLPALAAVPDDDKTTYATILGAILAVIAVVRAYKRPDIREWADEVANELTKVKWPTRKEVTSATIVVISATTVATLYLALLDRFWAFVTNLVYGTSS